MFLTRFSQKKFIDFRKKKFCPLDGTSSRRMERRKLTPSSRPRQSTVHESLVTLVITTGNSGAANLHKFNTFFLKNKI